MGIKLLILSLIVFISCQFGQKKIAGYYLPLEHSNKFECLILFDDYTSKHITVFEEDTLIDVGEWDFDEDRNWVGVTNMRWLNRYLLKQKERVGYANFKWDAGLLDIGLDELNFEKKSNSVPKRVEEIRLQNPQ